MNNEKARNCSECQVGSLTPSVYSDDFNHGQSSVHVDGLERCVCDTCGADPIFSDQIRRNQLRIADAKRATDGRLLGAEVREIRKVLGLSQHDASYIFGGGENAFSKYERGDTLQSGAMDCLLRLMSRHPFLIKEFEQERVSIGPSMRASYDFSWHDADELENSAESYSDIRESVTVFSSDYGDSQDWQQAA